MPPARMIASTPTTLGLLVGQGLQALGDGEHGLVREGVPQRVHNPIDGAVLLERNDVELRAAEEELVLTAGDRPLERRLVQDRRVVPAGLLDAPVLVSPCVVGESDRPLVLELVGADALVVVDRGALFAHGREHQREVHFLPQLAERGRDRGAVGHHLGLLALGCVVRRRRSERALEGLAHDHAEHRAQLLARGSRQNLRVAEELGHPLRGGLGLLGLGVVQDLRAEVLEVVGIPGVLGWVSHLAEEQGGLVGRTILPVSVQDLDAHLGRPRSLLFLRLLPGSHADRRLRGIHIGVHEPADRLLERVLGHCELEVARDAVEGDLLEVAGGKTVESVRVAQDLAGADRLAAALGHLDVLGDSPDEAGELEDVPGARDALLQRLHELLLTNYAVEVRVGVAMTDEVERVPAVQELVAGLQVERRIPEALLVVEVALVDVHVDAVEPVDDLLERLEVDCDHVVDRDPGQLLHRRQRPLGAAVRVGLVDPAGPRRMPLAPRVSDDEVAREREQRHDIPLRIDPNEHDRVRAGAGGRIALPYVVADDDADGGLVRP